MTFIIDRGFAERQILKMALVSWSEWNILIDFCVNIDSDKI